MDNRFDYTQIPQGSMTALGLYIDRRVKPGDFLTAVLENDLMRACSHADHINIDLLPVYAAYLYNEAPYGCYGSPKAVTDWLAGNV